MTLNQVGLLMDVFGALAVGLEANIKTRGLHRDMIVVGHGVNDQALSLLSIVGYLLLVADFVCQFLAAI